MSSCQHPAYKDTSPNKRHVLPGLMTGLAEMEIGVL